MKLVKVLELMRLYSKCPECGCETVGGGTGTLEITDGCFKRTCQCGWSVEVQEESHGSN